VIGDVLKWSGPLAPIGQNDGDGELVRLARSIEEALTELEQSAKRIEVEFDSALAEIFRAHGEMLRGLFVSGKFERELRASLSKCGESRDSIGRVPSDESVVRATGSQLVAHARARSRTAHGELI
jgi:signal transduction protein with GAF and PtsI domain